MDITVPPFLDFTNFLRASDDLNANIISQDRPAVHDGSTNAVKLKYVTSANNTGSWRALFQTVMTQGMLVLQRGYLVRSILNVQ